MKCPECGKKLEIQGSVKLRDIVIGETYHCENTDCVIESLDINYSEVMQIREKKKKEAKRK